MHSLMSEILSENTAFKASLENEDNNATPEPTDNNTGTPVKRKSRSKYEHEKEHHLYARILDFTQFKKATRSIEIKQYELQIQRTEGNVASGKLRVREVIENGERRNELTIKIKTNEGYLETNTRCNDAMLRSVSLLCTKASYKHRYEFPVEGKEDAHWDVDLFPDGKGGYHAWARIELEVEDLKDKIPPLPFHTEELILPKGMDQQYQGEEYDKLVNNLYKTIFIHENPHLERFKSLDISAMKDQENTPAADNQGTLDEDPSDDDEMPSMDVTEEEEKVQADDISSEDEQADINKEKAEAFEEKKKEEEGEDEDDNDNSDEDKDKDSDSDDKDAEKDASDEKDTEDTNDSKKDDEDKKEDKDDEIISEKDKESIDGALESLSKLFEFQVRISKGEYLSMTERQIIRQHQNRFKPTPMSYALESQDETDKTVMDSITGALSSFSSWVGGLPDKIVDRFKSKSDELSKVKERAIDLLGEFKANGDQVDVGKPLNLKYPEVYVIGDEFHQDAYRKLTQFILTYHDQYGRIKVYDEMKKILTDIEYDDENIISPTNLRQFSQLDFVPSKGFFKSSTGKETETWSMHVYGSNRLVINKPHVVSPEQIPKLNFNIKPSREVLDVEVAVNVKSLSAQEYIKLLEDIIHDCNRIETHYRELFLKVRDMVGGLDKTILKEIKELKNDGTIDIEIKEVKIYSEYIIGFARNTLAYALSETDGLYRYWIAETQKHLSNIKQAI